MCEPTTIVATALSVASVATNASAQNKASKANKKAAKSALGTMNKDISFRALQEKIAAQQESMVLNNDAVTVAGNTRVSAAAGGVGGMTVDMLLQDTEARRLAGLEQIGDQTEANLDQLGRERNGAAANYRSQVAAVPRANPWATSLRIASAGVDAYGAVRGRQPSVKPPSGPGRPK